MNPIVERVSASLIERSRTTRQAYLHRIQRAGEDDAPRQRLSCGNLAHSYAACADHEKSLMRDGKAPNIGIVSAYNDVLSAHQPFASYPDSIKQTLAKLGGTAQVAAGVPAMCDGITQGQGGMELSLFSRDVIAMATAVGLSHNVFNGVICLGVCDKIVPGMLMGALQFGNLPVVFVPAGPMPSGIPNNEKAKVRQQFAEGKASRQDLLDAESASYHSPGTCTFYGTANTNQLLMEAMGLQLPGASFVNPDTPLRQAFTVEAARRVLAAAEAGRPQISQVVNEAAIINALVALLASGGSTNHTLHLVAIARAAGILLRWEDFNELSAVVPLLVRAYPNGNEDVNTLQEAGGTAFLFRELRRAGLLNESVHNLMGEGMAAYGREPLLQPDGRLTWVDSDAPSTRSDVLRPVQDPFETEGGLRLLRGNLGQAVVKTSAVAAERRSIIAPCKIFHHQEKVKEAFQRGELDQDFVAVLRFQGPQANGMPELHQLTPYLGILQDRGFKLALLTDGRMSGASGKVLAAIHLSPEAKSGGAIARLQDGDLIEVDANTGRLNVLLDEAELAARELAPCPAPEPSLGRFLFVGFRQSVGDACEGASVFFSPELEAE